MQFEVQSDPISFHARVNDFSNLLDTSDGALIYTDQFIELSLTLPTSHMIYGIGERRGNLSVSKMGWSHGIWNRDIPPIKDYNLYGDHPIWITFDKETGSYYGYVFWNSNAKSFTITNRKVIIRTSGGIIDLFFMWGHSPEEVVQQIHSVLGTLVKPPIWSMGYHLSRWGYNSSIETLDITREMRNAGIPQEVQWNDIDYMFKKRDFTYDPLAFGSLPTVVKEIHSYHQKYVVILDPAIPTDIDPTEIYSPLEDGLNENIFIKDENGNIAKGVVWPGGTYFPDFSSHKTYSYWARQVERLFNSGIEFDGIWIDMNEPSSFIDGSVNGCAFNALNNPPWTPPIVGGSLFSKTLCPSFRQAMSEHYNVHNLYGLHETKATHHALLKLKPGIRPFILSRSTTLTSGRYTAHWTGDNYSRWEDLRYSITAMINLNIFGIKMSGVDVCGFQETSTEELCVRWHQVGSFLYSFFRNHNSINLPPQHPSYWSADAQRCIQKAIMKRYELLPYLYTVIMTEIMYIRPLVFDLSVPQSWASVETQFFVGNILVCPPLESGVTKVDCVIPIGIWCNIFGPITCFNLTETAMRSVETTIDNIPAFFRGGNIYATQKPAMTIHQVNIHLIICVV